MDLSELIKWIPWHLVPTGSLSHDGFGRFLLIWPTPDELGLDLVWFIHLPHQERPEARLKGPEQVFKTDWPIGCPSGKVEVLRTGLTTEQIQAFIEATPDPEVTPEQLFEQVCG